MIQYFVKDNNEILEVETESKASWINIEPPFEKGELESFALDHDIPLDFLTDPLDVDSRSRYEREDNALLVIVNTPILNENRRDNDSIYFTEPIGIIIVDNKIVTVSDGDNPILEKFKDNKVKNFQPTNVKLFMLKIFEQNVLEFLDDIKKLNIKRNLIEQELYNSSRNKELQQLLRIEKSLVYFVNSLSTNDLLKLKMKRTDALKIRDDEYLNDLFEDIIIDSSQALEMSNVHTNILGGTMEAYASIVSNNMNSFINRLTIVTIVLMVPTLIASFYGMNVKLPGQDWPYTFVVLIVFTILSVGGLIYFFRRNNQW